MKSLIKSKLLNLKLFLFLIIFFQVILLLFFINDKASFFCDEIYSYSLANSQYGHLFPPEGHDTNIKVTDRWLSGKFFLKYICATEKSKFNFTNPYLNNLNDSHPPLYNCIIHFICSFFPNSFSKWYGYCFNIFVFILSQLLLFSISKRILKSETYALLTCFIFGCSSISVECFISIRVYPLLIFIYLLCLKVYLICLDFNVSIKRFAAITAVVALGGMTHYHFLVYAFFLTLTFIIICLIKKKYKSFWCMSFAAILGVIFSISYYPFIFYQFGNSPRAKEAFMLQDRFSPLINGISSVFQEFLGLDLTSSLYLTIILITLFTILLVIYLINNKLTNTDTLALNLTIISFIVHSLLIYHTLDFRRFGVFHMFMERYFAPVSSTVAILIVAYLAKYRKIQLTILVSILSAISPFFMLDFSFPSSNPKFSTFQELGKLLKSNNVIVHCRYPEEVQTICPYFIDANKIYIDSSNSDNLVLPKSYPQSGNTYFICFNNDKNQIKYKKVLDGWLWSYGTRYEVYELDNTQGTITKDCDNN